MVLIDGGPAMATSTATQYQHLAAARLSVSAALPNVVQLQPKSMSKTSVLPPEWAWNRLESGRRTP